MMAKARRSGVPLKVKLPDHLTVAIEGFDPCTPMKKRPVFAEFAGPEAEAAMRNLEPGVPVKKRVPVFVLEEALRAPDLESARFRPPPGLESAAPGLEPLSRRSGTERSAR